jgi:hypothetical protein
MKIEDNNLPLNYKNYNINFNLNKINWDSYRGLPNNIQHHIFSLRWLVAYPGNLQNNIAFQFCEYFDKTVDAGKFLFYLGKYADHTASIRIKILVKILGNDLNEDIHKVISVEVSKTFKSIYDGDTYAPGRNHALMCDLALLACSQKVGANNEIINNIKNRLIENIKSIFDIQTGACKEHSISYQEFNLSLIQNALNEISSLSSEIINKEELEFLNIIYLRVKRFSKYILYSSWLKGYGYLPIGDTFSSCKPNILKKVFNVNNPGELFKDDLLPIVFFSKSFGVYLYKTQFIQLSLQNSFHSNIHKQNDDLSITLSINGDPFFIDGGYDDLLTGPLKLKGAGCHSMPICKNMNLNSSVDFKSGSLINVSDDYMCITAEHSRYGDLIVKRDINFNSEYIYIKDSLSVNEEGLVTQFILAPSLKIKFLDSNSMMIYSEVTSVTLIFSGDVFVDEIDLIFKDLPSKSTRISIENSGSGLFTVVLPNQHSQIIDKSLNFYTDDHASIV